MRVPTQDEITWFLASLGAQQTLAGGGAPLQAEYRELLAQRTVDELRLLAQARDIEVSAESKPALIESLAPRLCDLEATCAQIADTPSAGRRILAYLHLALTPGRGLSAENAIGEISIKIASPYLDPSSRKARALSTPDDLDPDDERPMASYMSMAVERRNVQQVYAHLMSLCRRGLLLTFEQHNTTYYSVPLAVRACLPPAVHIPPLPDKQLEGTAEHTRSHAGLVQKLYNTWKAIAASRARGHNITLSDPPPRQPTEDQWAALQGWDHLPSEIAALARSQLSRNAQGQSARNLTQSITIPAPRLKLGPANRRLLSEETGCTDHETDFYLDLLQQIGALSTSGNRIAASAPKMHQFLCLPPDRQVHTLYHAWSVTTSWSEMHLVLNETGDPEADTEPALRLRRSLMYAEFKPADLYREWRAGRLAVLRFLTTLPEDRWIPIDGLLAAIWDINANLLHSQSAPSVWWLESRRTRKQFGATFDDWQQSYGQFVAAAIRHALAWLGLVRLATRDGAPVAFKLTPTGRMVLGKQGLPDELRLQAGPAVRLGENLTIRVTPNRAPPELHELLAFAGEIVRATPSQFAYRLTAEGIRRWCLAAQEDASIPPGFERDPETAIRRLIERLSRLLERAQPGTAIPHTWEHTLLTWMRHFGMLHVYQGITVLDLADDYVLRELLASTSLREHVLYQFSPRLIAIRPEAIDDLVEEMEKRGYTPRVE